MEQISIKKIAKIIGSAIPETGITAGRVCVDSRGVKTGDCFFAIKGDNFDGHDFIDQAFANGASCAVVSDDREAVNILNVDNTIDALGRLANYYRHLAGYKVIAITGSAGKTTTKDMVHHVLARHFCCYRSPKSFNNNIGLPLTLLGAGADTEIVIAEIGSNHPGEISPLSIMAAPDVAAITNIYPTHLEGFGSIEAIIKEKVSITDGLGKAGVLLINAAFDGLVSYCNDKKLRFKTFGSLDGPDLCARSSSFNVDGVEIILPLPGRANVENALAALAICGEFGIGPKLFAEAIRTFTTTGMRLEIMEIGQVTVLNDCYNANPASMANAVRSLKTLAKERNGRAVFVCGAMEELGAGSGEYHAGLGETVAEMGVDLLLTAGDLAGAVATAAQKKAPSGFESEMFEKTAQLCDNLAKFIEPDDIILVKASRGQKFEVVVDKLKELFAAR